MALADYRLCDICERKVFYDSNLNYRWGAKESEEEPYRIAGEEQYNNAADNHAHGIRLDYLGDWAVLCGDCAKKFKTQIVPIETQE